MLTFGVFLARDAVRLIAHTSIFFPIGQPTSHGQVDPFLEDLEERRQ